MECNRDEALRVKEMAESKFLVKDFKGAKKFALKAKNLYPELDGISQMLMTLDVYISAQDEKIHGESNWYGVLGVNPFSDDETIRRQYRKLALLLHPDKNRSIGAEGAFQLISQAWSLLSDKSRKTAYDRSCGRKFQHSGGKHDAKQGGFHDFVKSVSGDSKKRKNPPSSAPRSSSQHTTAQEKETFWTVCHRCKMQYEYLRMYINHNLLCPNCNEAYFATEIAPPSNIDSKTLFQNSGIRHRKSKHSPPDCQWIPFSKSTGGGAPSAVQAANLVQQAFEKVKRERQKVQAAARKQEAVLRKNLSSKRMRTEPSSLGQVNTSSKRFKVAEQPGSMDKEAKRDVEPRLDDFRQLLMEKARKQIREKLNAGRLPAADGFKSFEAVDGNVGPQREGKSVEKVSMDVPDSDFHDFEASRRAESFGSDQVWAVYDDDDGMPRHYARIHEVISLEPFGVRLSWLRPVTHRDGFSHVSWYANGFSKTCGKFQMGRTEIFNSVDCFSHVVVGRWKSGSDAVLIYPRRGEVWAVHRNWSLEWNELTEYEAVHKYDIVEVLEDHDEEHGVIVVPLVKAAGSRAVFCRHFDPSRIRRIPAGEISRFSHQLPSRSFTGDEHGLKLLKGFRELDPAAVPSEILEAGSSLGLDDCETS
ncbi:hypothetical protein M569_17600 [Genlisea aurea]|uniref:J domain-containing protein n=1 Tax=Genlisea aurea TaxID=192259 RepID=S8BRG4_9LAMI|nr:hypothetical protein M569_17600 [Genlisea aurea]